MSCVVHEDKAYAEGRRVVDKLREVIPRQMFRVAIQAVIGSKVIASTHINAFRKGKEEMGFEADAAAEDKHLTYFVE